MDASNYDGPLTAAELAAWKKRHGPQRNNIVWRESGQAFAPTAPPGSIEAKGYAQDRAEATDASRAHWSACYCGTTQPMAAEASTDEGSDFPRKAKRKRTLHWSIAVPLYCALVGVFFSMAWFIEFLPSSDTAKTIGLLIGAPLALIAVVALLARWLH